jgi:hypothetical protein
MYIYIYIFQGREIGSSCLNTSNNISLDLTYIYIYIYIYIYEKGFLLLNHNVSYKDVHIDDVSYKKLAFLHTYVCICIYHHIEVLSLSLYMYMYINIHHHMKATFS